MVRNRSFASSRKWSASLVVLVLAATAWAAEPPRQVIATLEGQPIYRDEVEARVSVQVFKLEAELHRLLVDEARALAEERLLAAEAERRGLAVDELLASETAVAEASDAEVEAYLAEYPPERASPEEARRRVRTFLTESRRLERRAGFLAELGRRAGFEVVLDEPTRRRTALDVESAPARGDAKAAVTLVGFTSFREPASAAVAAEIRRLMAEHPGKLRQVHSNALARADELALEAALLAVAAAENGRFWELYDALMELGGRFDGAVLEELAEKLGITADEERHLARLRDENAFARKIGVLHTPVVFVNGRYWSGTFPLAGLRRLVLEELGLQGEEPRQNLKEETTAEPR